MTHTPRTRATQAKYDAVRQKEIDEGYCPFCDYEPIKKFKYWKIVANKYPYDRTLSVHHMATPLRHAREEDLTVEEIAEWEEIRKGAVNDDYEMIFEPTMKGKTRPDHCHWHLAVFKEEYSNE